MGFNKVKAETVIQSDKSKTISEWLWERGNIENNPYAESGNMYEMGFGENFSEAVELWKGIGESLSKVLEWINNVNESITHLSVDLLAWVYKTLSMLVLHTPVMLFTNEWFKDNVLTFASLSMTVFAITFIYQTVRKMSFSKEMNSGFKFTEPKEILKRFAIAITGIGFAPYLFEKGFTFLNIVAKFITSLGYHEVKANEFKDVTASTGDALALVGFDLVLIGMLVPIFLQNGRRWFDLVCLGSLTPLALSAWCFNDTKHYTSTWWKSIKDIGMVQIVYSFFIAVMGIFLVGTRGYTTGFGLIVKLAIIAGGLYRMSNPPMFLSRMMDTNNGSILTMFNSLKKTLSMESITKYKPVNKFKDNILNNVNASKINKRLATGKRFNK